MNLTDDRGVKIYKKVKEWSGGTFNTYSMSVASKDKDGNWINGYIDCNFKKADAEKITNKCKITIKNAFPTVTESNGKKYVKWLITDFEVIEEGEAPTSGDGFVAVNPDELPDFMNIDDDSLEGTPFA